MIVNVVKETLNELPKYETPDSAGMDLRADLWSIKEEFLFNARIVRGEHSIIQYIEIAPGGRALIPTGLKMALPKGYEAQIRPRSGLALKYGVTVLNTPGTIDADYRGDVGVILINHGSEPFVVKQGDRIAQMVIAKMEQITWNPVDSLEKTERGDGGFGHSGSN